MHGPDVRHQILTRDTNVVLVLIFHTTSKGEDKELAGN